MDGFFFRLEGRRTYSKVKTAMAVHNGAIRKKTKEGYVKTDGTFFEPFTLKTGWRVLLPKKDDIILEAVPAEIIIPPPPPPSIFIEESEEAIRRMGFVPIDL